MITINTEENTKTKNEINAQKIKIGLNLCENDYYSESFSAWQSLCYFMSKLSINKPIQINPFYFD